MKRLSDAEIANIADDEVGLLGPRWSAPMAHEIRERRAADLTADEMEALRRVAMCLGDHDVAEWSDIAKNAFCKLLAARKP